MKKAFITIAVILAAVGIIFYVLIANARPSTHMHFATRGGVLKNVVYYSTHPPETGSEHQCDGNFAEMADHLYETHVKLWQQKYPSARTGQK